MSNTEIEHKLERLGKEWPGKSVAEDVVSKLPDVPTIPIPSRNVDFRLYSWIGAVATVVVFAASLWISMPPSMQLALQDSLQDASKRSVKQNELSHKPTPLPETITGRVVDSNEMPIADANVTVRIRRFRSEKNFYENTGPGPWSATTDEKGSYSISPAGTVHPATDEVRIKVIAPGYADVSEYDNEKQLVKGSLPTVKLPRGRKLTGRLVDAAGNPVSAAVVRFQHNAHAMVVAWDSGPFSVDQDGTFGVAIPVGGKAIGVVYPKELSPRFVDITDASDQGDIQLEQGVQLRGRVLDRMGHGVAGTIVGFRNTRYPEMYGFVALIGSAVRTDPEGYFQLPPLRGTYKLTVSKSAPDYSRQMMVIGNKPPTIDSLEIDVDAADTDALLIMQEAE